MLYTQEILDAYIEQLTEDENIYFDALLFLFSKIKFY